LRTLKTEAVADQRDRKIGICIGHDEALVIQLHVAVFDAAEFAAYLDCSHEADRGEPASLAGYAAVR
jgi:hypothetical protein